jgi:hypothetical protein
MRLTSTFFTLILFVLAQLSSNGTYLKETRFNRVYNGYFL